MNVRSLLREGWVMGAIMIIVVLLGLNGLAGTIVAGWLGIDSLVLGSWLLLIILVMSAGAKALRYVEDLTSNQVLLAGALIGAADGLLMAILTGIMTALSASGAEVRKWLVQMTDDAIRLLSFGLSPLLAALLMFIVMTLGGLGGAAFARAWQRNEWGKKISAWFAGVRDSVKNSQVVHKVETEQRSRYIAYGVAAAILFFAPFVMGQYWNYTLGTVGIYVILGLGLNIVVGLAGLLDLGYVAFFAIGAYTVAILTAPTPHNIGMSFWLVLPIGVLLAAISGVLLGIPVLRMRGDYLAIVTLGFGEIIRILSKSDVLTGFTGGPRGIRSVGGPTLFGIDLNNEFYFMYLILIGIVLAAAITNRLQHSRVGRAWMAMREDQDVAEAMGIHVLRYKLLAFAIGAAFAGFSGVLFASRNKFTGPEDFVLLVSINVLCLVIIGGMGSIPGVVVGALVLKGLPEILRQLSDYRMLAFGALLVVTMIVRPEGLWPSGRRRMELAPADSGESLDEGEA